MVQVTSTVVSAIAKSDCSIVDALSGAHLGGKSGS